MTVGASLPRPDAAAKVMGRAIYPADIQGTDMLHAVIVFSDQPHARLLSMDITDALDVPGVVTIVTAGDIPMNEYGLTEFDQPVFIGLDATGRSRIDPTVSRWEGDHIAVVVAETDAIGRRAADLIVTTWEPLAIVETIEEALAPDAPLLHPENGLPTNVYHSYKIRKGDMEAGWAAADVVVESTYQLPHQEHAFLQPEAGVAYLDDEGRVTVEIAGQWTHEDQEQIAHALDLPLDQVRVVYPAIGGAFGGREDMSMQIVLAAAALKVNALGDHRPIRSQWSREESIVGHHKRHRATITTRWGATAEGVIVAVEADGFLDAGAYNYTSNKVMGNLHVSMAGPYRVPNARIDTHVVYTTSVPGGAFRGFGGPQGSFAAEMQMNKLAEALGDGSRGTATPKRPRGRRLRYHPDRDAGRRQHAMRSSRTACRSRAGGHLILVATPSSPSGPCLARRRPPAEGEDSPAG